MAAGAGLLVLLAQMSGGNGPPIHFAWATILPFGALIALALGLITGLPPALGAYRMRVVDAFATR